MPDCGAQFVKQEGRLTEAESLPEIRKRRLDEKLTERMFEIRENQSWHNPYDQEIRELTAITLGDVKALEESILEEYEGGLGILHQKDQLRNAKNIGIVVITLASRAAIRGGISPELAFASSDIYINELETCTDIATLLKITRGAEYRLAQMVRMISDQVPDQAEKQEQSPFDQIMYLERQKKKGEEEENDHISKAKAFIFKNLHQRISTKEIAEELHLNPRYLSGLFHQVTGMTISRYIRREKIRLAMNMLKYSDYTFLEIAHYLGFSSQSHLGEQFRQETGMTLKEYRQRFGKKGDF